MRHARPLRSVLIGDVTHYPSEYIFGVNQGMTLLGHWHSTVDIRADIDTIHRRLVQVQPDIIWGHMLLWAPGGPNKTSQILEMCEHWHRRGAKVVMHDGDARADTRFPIDVSCAIDLVLCNHIADRSIWNIRAIRWPYFAFVQRFGIARSDPEWACDLAFAGRLSSEGIYAERTRLVEVLGMKLGTSFRVFPSVACPNQHTLMCTPTLAASAVAVLGYGRPESPGWLDVRLFQYTGAGGVLLYDDVERASEYLSPWVHFVPYIRHDPESVLSQVSWLTQNPDVVLSIRHAAFYFVQSHHTSTHRVQQVLTELFT